jgi:hypothetical protein
MAFRVSALFSACQPSPARDPFDDAGVFFLADADARFAAPELKEFVALLIIFSQVLPLSSALQNENPIKWDETQWMDSEYQTNLLAFFYHRF